MKKTMRTLAVSLFLASTLSMSATETNRTPKPPKTAESFVLKESGDMIYLNLLNLDRNPVQVVVRDGAGRIIFSETIENENSVHKAFNFTKAYAGTYEVKVKDGKKNYSEKIVIG